MSWRGTRGGIAAARAGHDAVMVPSNVSYFNYRNARTMDVDGYSPVPHELSADQAKHILGVQACYWSRMVRTEDGVDNHIFPRLLATAEIAWSPKEPHDTDSFRSRIRAQLDRLECLGVNYDRDASVVGEDDYRVLEQ